MNRCSSALDDRQPLVYPFFAEEHLRRGRTVLRPVVRISIADLTIVVDALVDTGSEHVLADSSLAIVAGLDLSHPIDIEEIGLGGGIAEARFLRVPAFLHPPEHVEIEPIEWEIEVGFIDNWRPLYPCILGNVGFIDQFTVTVNRFAQATALEHVAAFDDRFGSG
jgi:hypothetical protein